MLFMTLRILVFKSSSFGNPIKVKRYGKIFANFKKLMENLKLLCKIEKRFARVIRKMKRLEKLDLNI